MSTASVSELLEAAGLARVRLWPHRALEPDHRCRRELAHAGRGMALTAGSRGRGRPRPTRTSSAPLGRAVHAPAAAGDRRAGRPRTRHPPPRSCPLAGVARAHVWAPAHPPDRRACAHRRHRPRPGDARRRAPRGIRVAALPVRRTRRGSAVLGATRRRHSRPDGRRDPRPAPRPSGSGFPARPMSRCSVTERRGTRHTARASTSTSACPAPTASRPAAAAGCGCSATQSIFDSPPQGRAACVLAETR
jgi:hypothetical protein